MSRSFLARTCGHPEPATFPRFPVRIPSRTFAPVFFPTE